jgi:hypothetical protein
MEDSGRTRRDIAQSVGLSPAYLTMLVNGRYVSSSHVDALSVELGIFTSDQSPSTPAVREVLDRANQMDEKRLRALIIMMDAMNETKH